MAFSHLFLPVYAFTSSGQNAAQIWKILFQRLQAAKTARYVRGFLVFLSHFVVKRSPAAMQASTDTVQPGIFLIILQQACAQLLKSLYSTSWLGRMTGHG